MKWLLVVVALVFVAALIVVGVGLLLPKKHEASGQANIAAKPDAVFAIITDFASDASWRTGVKKVELLPPRNGRPAFKEWGGNGEMTYVVEESEPPRWLVTRIVDQPAFGGTWTYELTPEGSGTRVEITERGEVYNPVFRFLSRFVFSQTKTIERYLGDLKRRAEAGG